MGIRSAGGLLLVSSSMFVWGNAFNGESDVWLVYIRYLYKFDLVRVCLENLINDD